MKQCCRCKKTKSYDSFYRRSRATDGYASECKECKAKIDHKSFQKWYWEEGGREIRRTGDYSERKCPQCGKEFKPEEYSRSGSTRKYCDESCGVVVTNRRQTIRRSKDEEYKAGRRKYNKKLALKRQSMGLCRCGEIAELGLKSCSFCIERGTRC